MLPKCQIKGGKCNFLNFKGTKGVFGSHRIGGLELELEHQFQIFGLDATSARELEFNSNSMGHQFHKFNSLVRPKNYNSNSIISPPIRVSTRILMGKKLKSGQLCEQPSLAI